MSAHRAPTKNTHTNCFETSPISRHMYQVCFIAHLDHTNCFDTTSVSRHMYFSTRASKENNQANCSDTSPISRDISHIMEISRKRWPRSGGEVARGLGSCEAEGRCKPGVNYQVGERGPFTLSPPATLKKNPNIYLRNPRGTINLAAISGDELRFHKSHISDYGTSKSNNMHRRT